MALRALRTLEPIYLIGLSRAILLYGYNQLRVYGLCTLAPWTMFVLWTGSLLDWLVTVLADFYLVAVHWAHCLVHYYYGISNVLYHAVPHHFSASSIRHSRPGRRHNTGMAKPASSSITVRTLVCRSWPAAVNFTEVAVSRFDTHVTSHRST
jgi:hypothetical protein